MKAHARYVVVDNDPAKSTPLVIRDVGPWDEHPTVTNDAEAVVDDLAGAGALPRGRRLLYIDSDGRTDELLHADGQFVGYGPGPVELLRAWEEGYRASAHAVCPYAVGSKEAVSWQTGRAVAIGERGRR